MHYQQLSLEYIEDIKQMIIHEFKIHLYCSPKDFDVFSTIYIYQSLLEANFSSVFVNENKVQGFILGQIKGEKSLIPKRKVYVLLVFSILKLCGKLIVSKETRNTLTTFLVLFRKTKKLLQNNTDYPAQVLLFAVDKNLQGKGIGKTLMRNFQEHLNSLGISAFFLYTDSTCSYQFYEKSGFKRINEVSVSLEHFSLDLFLYAKKLTN